MDVTIDAKGLSCPSVILRMKKDIAGLASGDTVELLATDPMSESDVTIYCKAVGHEILDITKMNEIFRFLVKIN